MPVCSRISPLCFQNNFVVDSESFNEDNLSQNNRSGEILTDPRKIKKKNDFVIKYKLFLQRLKLN